jgi:hypothetical protein
MISLIYPNDPINWIEIDSRASRGSSSLRQMDLLYSSTFRWKWVELKDEVHED